MNFTALTGFSGPQTKIDGPQTIDETESGSCVPLNTE